MASASASAPKRFYRPDEVQEILKVCRRTVYYWLAEGLIPNIKVGRTIRIPVDRFEACLETLMRRASRETVQDGATRAAR